MLGLKRLAVLSNRLLGSTGARQISSYNAVNEPIMGYESGSPERIELDAKLAEFENTEFDVPIVIGDEEIRTKNVMRQVRPFDHQRTLAKFYYADEQTIKRAIDVSQEAHREWEARSLEERADIFKRAVDALTTKNRMEVMAATMLGQAKTIVQAEIDCACELIDFYRFNLQWALELTKWQPLDFGASKNTMSYRSLEGFWAAIAPFNFTAISGHIAGAPALMGNVVLWKPSDTAVLSSYLVFKILREAGVPAGVINFLPCDGPVFGKVITTDHRLAGINFTGSQRTFETIWKDVGNNIQNYRSFPRLIGECGGKNYHVVHPSADVQSVINGTIRSAFEYSGQKCSACSRMYVAESTWAEIKQGLLEAHKEVKTGSVLDPENLLSAVIDDKAFARIKGYIDHAKSSPNLEILAGGNCDDSKGYYIEPTIIQTKDPKDKIMQEEIFGPVVAIYVYPDNQFTETLKLVESTSPYALTGAVYAEDMAAVDEASKALRFTAGNFYVNDKSTGSVVAQQPFGGARKSGTNDKAGAPNYLLRFVSPQSVKTTEGPMTGWKYPYMSK